MKHSVTAMWSMVALYGRPSEVSQLMLRRRQGGRLEARGIQLVIEVAAIKAHRRKRFAFVIRNSYAQQLSKASSS